MRVPPQEADADVHVRLRAGDYRGALQLLLPRYRDRVFRLAISMLRDRSEAEDVVQEIFLRLWRALSGYNGRASLSTWLYAISRNACLSRIRQRRSEVSLDDPTVQSEWALQAGRAPGADDTADSLTRMLASLSERHRQVVTLFYMEDKSCEQTAAALGIPVGTVKALLHRARRHMMDIAATETGGN